MYRPMEAILVTAYANQAILLAKQVVLYDDGLTWLSAATYSEIVGIFVLRYSWC